MWYTFTMLKELLAQQNELPKSDTLRFPEFVDKSVETFDVLVDFLRDSERFPNTEVNELVTLTWRLIGNRRTPVTLDQWGVKSLSFVAYKEESSQKAMFIMPTDFIDLVREDPVMQMGAVVFNASQGRDFYTGRLISDGSQIVNRRARAFEAETLHTLSRMAKGEGVTLRWNPYQSGVLNEFPQGLRDLPNRLNYPTPVYKL